MMNLLKRKHTIATSFEDSKYLEEFFDAYHIKHEALYHKGQIEFHAEMFRREFDAFCNYICELNLMGVYPIKL